MKTQASKCSKVEVHWLNHWRRHGHRIGRNDVIPCCIDTPPRHGLVQRRPILDALLGLGIIVGVFLAVGLWVGLAAGVI